VGNSCQNGSETLPSINSVESDQLCDHFLLKDSLSSMQLATVLCCGVKCIMCAWITVLFSTIVTAFIGH
jgi:hypothetical protein